MTDSGVVDITVGVLLYPGCIIAEVIEPASRLARAGARVEWIGADREPFTDESGLVLNPAMSIAECDPARLQALLVPGGDPRSVIGDPSVRRLVVEVSDGGVVASICGPRS